MDSATSPRSSVCARTLRRRPGSAFPTITPDLSRAAEVAALVAATEAEFGGVDILVNNAGLQHVAPVEEFPPEKWDQLRAVILDASFHTIRAALPAFRSTVVGRPADQRR